MSAAYSDTAAPPTAFVALSIARGRALMRGIVWCAGAPALGLSVLAVASRLDFKRTGVHSLLVEASLAMVALPFAAAAIACAAQGIRQILLATWLGEVGIEADADKLTLRLGPFGTRAYPVSELDIKYLFELSGDEESFEAFLPEETQRKTMLPRMIHPAAKEPIQRTILKFAAGTESEIAERMRAWIERVSGKRSKAHHGT